MQLISADDTIFLTKQTFFGPQKLLPIIGPIFQYCQKQPSLPRQSKTHLAFSMFPILDTNLCLCPILTQCFIFVFIAKITCFDFLFYQIHSTTDCIT